MLEIAGPPLQLRKVELIMISLEVNGKKYDVDALPDTPLLWVLREKLGLTGTKYGCGIAACGACTVHIDGKAERSCQVPLVEAEGTRITTIEGIAKEHPVIAAWIKEQVPQCGYCQSGQIMEAIAFLSENPNPTDEEIAGHLSEILCRCGTYPRIARAVKLAAKGGRS